MRVQDRVDREHGPVLRPIGLDAALEPAPPAVQPITPGTMGVVDCLAVQIHHVGPGIGEAPGHVAVEADADGGAPGDGHAIDVQLSPNHEMSLVPDAGQGEIEVGIAGENGVSLGGP